MTASDRLTMAGTERAAPFAIAQVARYISHAERLRLIIGDHELTHPRESDFGPSVSDVRVSRVRSSLTRCLHPRCHALDRARLA